MLLYAMGEDWPKVGGRPRHYDYRAVVVLASRERGWTVEDLAHAWETAPGEIRRWLVHAERRLEDEQEGGRLGPEPRIVALQGEPPRPAELVNTHCSPDELERRREEHRRMNELPEQVRDVLGGLAPFANVIGPPTPEQLEAARRHMPAFSLQTRREQLEQIGRSEGPLATTDPEVNRRFAERALHEDGEA